jgi:hypothetical protein
MADNTTLSAGTGGDVIATDDIAGVKVQRVKVQHGADGSATDVSTASPLPVDQTNTTVADGGALPAKGMQVGGTDGSVFQVISTDNAGRVNVNVNGTVTTSGPLTDTQLRASAVPVSGPLTDTQLRASAVPSPARSRRAGRSRTPSFERARSRSTRSYPLPRRSLTPRRTRPLPRGRVRDAVERGDVGPCAG